MFGLKIVSTILCLYQPHNFYFLYFHDRGLKLYRHSPDRIISIQFPNDSPPYSSESLTYKEQPRDPLQYLVEAEAGPQAQVGPEEVEGAHEAEPVHGGDLHSDVLVEDETEGGVAGVSGGSLLYTGLSYQTGRSTVGAENTIKEALLRK